MTSSILNVQKLDKNFITSSGTVEILKGLDLEVLAKETVSIVGPSGSGKTSLLSLLAGLDQPTHGQILFEGQSLNSMSEEELSRFRAKNIGIIFQQFHLMPHLTALENVMLPLEILGHSKIEEKAKAALNDVGLSHRESHTPARLSGGECQRVAIARALVVEPKLLLADEPSGNLDQETGQNVMDLLFDICQKKEMTLLLITHDLELSRRCQKQLHLKSGKLHS